MVFVSNFYDQYYRSWEILHLFVLRQEVDFASKLSMFQVPLLRFCLYFVYCQDAPHLLITLRSRQLPSVYTIKMRRHFLKKVVIPNVNTL